MEYKGYIAKIEIDEKAGILFGKVQNIKDIITFQSDTVTELEREFHNSVEDYLEWCYELDELEKNVTDIAIKSSLSPTDEKIFSDMKQFRSSLSSLKGKSLSQTVIEMRSEERS